jgi:hypothetical protein
MPTLGSSLTERERARITSVQTQDVDLGLADAGDQDYADQDGDQEGNNEEEEVEDEAEDITPTTRETGKQAFNKYYLYK